jgi:hypothetical protein
MHFGVLYTDPDTNAVACSAYGVRHVAGQNKQSQAIDAARAVLCVTFRDR